MAVYRLYYFVGEGAFRPCVWLVWLLGGLGLRAWARLLTQGVLGDGVASGAVVATALGSVERVSLLATLLVSALVPLLCCARGFTYSSRQQRLNATLRKLMEMAGLEWQAQTDWRCCWCVRALLSPILSPSSVVPISNGSGDTEGNAAEAGADRAREAFAVGGLTETRRGAGTDGDATSGGGPSWRPAAMGQRGSSALDGSTTPQSELDGVDTALDVTSRPERLGGFAAGGSSRNLDAHAALSLSSTPPPHVTVAGHHLPARPPHLPPPMTGSHGDSSGELEVVSDGRRRHQGSAVDGSESGSSEQDGDTSDSDDEDLAAARRAAAAERQAAAELELRSAVAGTLGNGGSHGQQSEVAHHHGDGGTTRSAPEAGPAVAETRSHFVDLTSYSEVGGRRRPARKDGTGRARRGSNGRGSDGSDAISGGRNDSGLSFGKTLSGGVMDSGGQDSAAMAAPAVAVSGSGPASAATTLAPMPAEPSQASDAGDATDVEGDSHGDMTSSPGSAKCEGRRIVVLAGAKPGQRSSIHGRAVPRPPTTVVRGASGSIRQPLQSTSGSSSRRSSTSSSDAARRGSFIKHLSQSLGFGGTEPGTDGQATGSFAGSDHGAADSSMADDAAVRRFRRRSVTLNHAAILQLPRQDSEASLASSGRRMSSARGSAPGMPATPRGSGSVTFQRRLARAEQRHVQTVRATMGLGHHEHVVAAEEEIVPSAPLTSAWPCCGSSVLPLEVEVSRRTGEFDGAESVTLDAPVAFATTSAEEDDSLGSESDMLAASVNGDAKAGATVVGQAASRHRFGGGRTMQPVPSPGPKPPLRASLRPRSADSGQPAPQQRPRLDSVAGLDLTPPDEAAEATFIVALRTRARVCDPCPLLTRGCNRLAIGKPAEADPSARACLRRRSPVCPPPFMVCATAAVVVCTASLHWWFDAWQSALLSPGAGLGIKVLAGALMAGSLLLPPAAICFDAVRRNGARRRLDPGTVFLVVFLIATLPLTLGRSFRTFFLIAAGDTLLRVVVSQAAVVVCSLLTKAIEIAAPATTPTDKERQPLLFGFDVLLTLFLNLVSAQELDPAAPEFWLTIAVRCAGLLLLDTRVWYDVLRLARSGRVWCRFMTSRLGFVAALRADRILAVEQLAVIATAAVLAGTSLSAAAGVSTDVLNVPGLGSSAGLGGRLTSFAIIFVIINAVVPVVRCIVYTKHARSRLRNAGISVLGVGTAAAMATARASLASPGPRSDASPRSVTGTGVGPSAAFFGSSATGSSAGGSTVPSAVGGLIPRPSVGGSPAPPPPPLRGIVAAAPAGLVVPLRAAPRGRSPRRPAPARPPDPHTSADGAVAEASGTWLHVAHAGGSSGGVAVSGRRSAQRRTGDAVLVAHRPRRGQGGQRRASASDDPTASREAPLPLLPGAVGVLPPARSAGSAAGGGRAGHTHSRPPRVSDAGKPSAEVRARRRAAARRRRRRLPCCRPRKCLRRWGGYCLGGNRATDDHWSKFRLQYAAVVMPFAVLWGAWASAIALGMGASA